MKTKNTHLSPVGQIFKNEQGVAHQQIDEIYFAGQYRRLSFSSRKTKRTNLRAVNASARLCWHLLTSVDLFVFEVVEVAVFLVASYKRKCSFTQIVL